MRLTGSAEKIKEKAEATGLSPAQVVATERKEKHRKSTATRKQKGTYSSKVVQDKTFAEYVMGELEWAKYLATPTGSTGWEGEAARRPMSFHRDAAAVKDRKKQIKMLGVKDQKRRVVATLTNWTLKLHSSWIETRAGLWRTT